MHKLIIANWKMNPDSVGRAVRLARAEDKKGVVIAPPFPFLPAVYKVLRKSRLGAQDAFWIPKGAHTGEVSAHQLKHLRVQYVIVGHSERRALGETERMVNKKVKAALAEGITVILCVGEPWSVRKRGLSVAKRFVARQLRADLRGIENWKLKIGNLIIAYEPVWAIGSGKADKPAETAEMAKYIKEFSIFNFLRPRRESSTKSGQFSIRVLYGGSVTPGNAALFFREKGIDGALVGGASLSPKQFGEIVASAKV